VSDVNGKPRKYGEDSGNQRRMTDDDHNTMLRGDDRQRRYDEDGWNGKKSTAELVSEQKNEL
jgi:hypothetical protein